MFGGLNVFLCIFKVLWTAFALKKKVLYKYMLLPSISVKIQQENRLKYIILYLIRALSLILCRFFMFRIPENHIFSLNDHTFKQISQKKLYRTNVGDYLIFLFIVTPDLKVSVIPKLSALHRVQLYFSTCSPVNISFLTLSLIICCTVQKSWAIPYL